VIQDGKLSKCDFGKDHSKRPIECTPFPCCLLEEGYEFSSNAPTVTLEGRGGDFLLQDKNESLESGFYLMHTSPLLSFIHFDQVCRFKLAKC